MGDKVKWMLALLFLVLVLIGIRKVESIVYAGGGRCFRIRSLDSCGSQ